MNESQESPSNAPRFLSTRLFALCFTSLCVLFVPVVYFMGFLVVVAPTAYLITGFFNRWIGAPWMLLIHVTIYIAIFYGVGVLVRRLVHLLPWRPVRLLVFTAVLLLPFFSSFARVLTYASLWGSGGTYTFWEAVHRYNAKRR